jgi:predicted SPOUT superfamily RNA methylase MTH1
MSDVIHSKAATREYRIGYDTIFGRKQAHATEVGRASQVSLSSKSEPHRRGHEKRREKASGLPYPSHQ